MSDLAPLVNELIDLKRIVANAEEKIAIIQRRFIEEAQSALKYDGHKTFIDCSYTFAGMDGCIARVNFPADKLISSFRFNDADEAYRTQGTGKNTQVIKMPGLRKLAGDKFKVLFAPFFKPATGFRDIAPTHLGKTTYASLLELVTEPSSPRVSTEVAEIVP